MAGEYPFRVKSYRFLTNAERALRWVELREARGLTLEEAATRIGVFPYELKRWEDRMQQPVIYLTTLTQICEAYGVSPDVLFLTDVKLEFLPGGRVNRRYRFGVQIRRARKAKGWTQADLAEKADLGQSTISQVERDDCATVRFGTLLCIAKALGKELPELMEEEKCGETVKIWE